MRTSDKPLCACHAAPVADGAVLCPEGVAEAAEALRWLTADVSRHDREPELADDGTIAAGSCGRMPSTIWDTPSGEMRNLPRMLEESAARLAVRSTQARLSMVKTEPPLPIDLRAVDDAGRLREAVGRWATMTSGRQVPLDAAWDVPTVAAWLIEQLPTIRLQEWAGLMLAELKRLVGRAERHVDRAPERHYLSVCAVVLWQPQEGAEGPSGPVCGGQVFSVGSSPTGRCRACGEQYDVAERQAEMQERLRGARLCAADIEKAMRQLGLPVKRNTITKWAERGRLIADGAGRYLVDDVLVLAEQAAERRRKTAA